MLDKAEVERKKLYTVNKYINFAVAGTQVSYFVRLNVQYLSLTSLLPIILSKSWIF